MIGSTDRSVPEDLTYKAEQTLQRLHPRLGPLWSETETAECKQEEFEERLRAHWQPLFALLYQLYGHRYDFFLSHGTDLVRGGPRMG